MVALGVAASPCGWADRKPLSEGRRDEAETGVVTRPILPTPDKNQCTRAFRTVKGAVADLHADRWAIQARKCGPDPESKAHGRSGPSDGDLAISGTCP